MKERLQEMLEAVNRVSPLTGNFLTVDELLERSREATFTGGIHEAFTASALTDLHSYLKDLFKFLVPEQNLTGDVREDIRVCVEYFTEKFEPLSEKLGYIYDNTTGETPGGGTVNVKSILDTTINRITNCARILVKYS